MGLRKRFALFKCMRFGNISNDDNYLVVYVKVLSHTICLNQVLCLISNILFQAFYCKANAPQPPKFY